MKRRSEAKEALVAAAAVAVATAAAAAAAAAEVAGSLQGPSKLPKIRGEASASPLFLWVQA